MAEDRSGQGTIYSKDGSRHPAKDPSSVRLVLLIVES